MVLIRFLFLLLFISSCAKTNYLIVQGKGQLKLLREARPNHEVLADSTVSDEQKAKIRLVETYKKYFYDYFAEKPKDIYSKTNILKNEAVTYLVIASPIDRIEAVEEWFPFMGSFPYIGFYDPNDAFAWAKKSEEDGHYTYVRKVYAYSTLGYFEDPILSSFFYYDDVELAELVFHELFHTIFFAKNEVDLNESLANYFAEQIRLDYFKYDREINKKMERERLADDELMMKVIEIGQEWDQKLRDSQVKSKAEADLIQKDMVQNKLIPEIKKICQKFKSECPLLQWEWNNASMASLMTYERASDAIAKKHAETGLSLKEFLSYIKEQYKNFRNSGSKSSFEEFLIGTKS